MLADLTRPASAFWEHSGYPPRRRRRGWNARVSQLCLSATPTATSATLLKCHGVTAAPDGDLTVVVTDNYLRPEVEKQNIKSLADRKPWLLLKPVGMQTWNGPAFVPGQTGCWECLAQRPRGHRRLEEIHRAAQRRGCAGECASRLPSIVEACSTC